MKLIDLLLRLYPAEFRARYARDMRAFHADRVAEGGGRVSSIAIVTDHLNAAVREQMHSIKPDILYALRALKRRPAFAAVVILSIALGVGANAAIFSVVNAILLRPLPYGNADRIALLGHTPPQWLVSEPQYGVYRADMRSFSSLAAYSTNEGNVSTAEDPQRVAIASVTPNFFATMGVSPRLGRTFAEDEDHVRPSPLVVLGYRLWQRHYAGDPAIVGKSVVLNGTQRTVIGVMPERFEYPSADTQLWLPLCSQRTCASLASLAPDSLDEWASHYLHLVGRLRAGVSLARARSEATTIASRITRDHPDNFDVRSPLTPKLEAITDTLIGESKPYLVALFGAVGVILLIVCANVANLLLAAGETRRREIALRTALGASRRRLTMQLMTESLVLALFGGAVGLAVGWGGSRVLVALAPASLPRLEEVGIDWVVVAFCLVVAIVAGLIFGVVPAMRASAQSPAEALKASGKVAGAGPMSGRVRRALVVAEITLAMTLLTGAGMLVRSLIHLSNTDIGFDPHGALTAKVSLNNNDYDDTRAAQFYTALLGRVRAIPGVRIAGAARWLPVVDAGGTWDIRVEGKTLPAHSPGATPQEVTPGYFGAIGIRMRAGRDFTEQDRVGAPLVAIVSESFAKRIWGDDDPLNRRFRLGGRDSAWMSVVGVVGDIRSRGFTDTPEPTMYMPHAQAATSSYFAPRSMSLVVRTNGDPLGAVNSVRTAVRSLDATVPVSSVRTIDAVIGTSVANRRFTTTLIAGFALLALVLAGVGIYGVISYGVTQRTFEFGVRMALGADTGTLLGMVFRDGARLALIGIAIGLAASTLLARLIRSLLVGVPLIDLPTLSAVGVLLAVVAILASAIPARRATAVNPTDALRGG